MARKYIIAGNWKMNKTPAETKALLSEMVAKNNGKTACEVVLCVPAIDIPAAIEVTAGTTVKVGAQNVHFKDSGAYTGEISAQMLRESGVEYVIIGHSERRQYFGETDETVNLRTAQALANGLKAIVCVGETLAERKDDITFEVIGIQIKRAFKGISAEAMANVVIAYEPVWAIGTGETATNEQAEEVCMFIRGLIAELYGTDVANDITVQYGGSMNAKNAADLLAMDNIDGGLIGGASLKSEDFTVIVDSVK
ncbi:MAG: triose-phosphate isomerase [Clostridia bacterium]|nr:triose-phosphate isomerase [Clostridia bacterium]MBR5459458.1 triose-phosphate isomerase [Clostridia bacterium]